MRQNALDVMATGSAPRRPAAAAALALSLLAALSSCSSTPEAGRAPAKESSTDKKAQTPSANAEKLKAYWRAYVAQDPTWPDSRAAWLALGQGDAWILVENLLRELVFATDRGDVARAGRARRELSEIASVSIPYLAESLSRGDNVVRRQCVDVLVAIGPRSVGTFESRLPTLDVSGRREVAGALGRIQCPEAVPVLVRLARIDEDWQVRASAVDALGAYLPDAACERCLVEALAGDADGFVRRRAAAALDSGEGPESASLLVATLRDRDPETRAAAATALAARRVAGAVDPLIAALEVEVDPKRSSEVLEVKEAIHDALATTTGVDFGLDVARWKRFRETGGK